MLGNDSYWGRIVDRRVRRRRALMGVGAGALGSALLAACGGDGGSSGSTSSGDDEGTVTKPVDSSSKAVKGGVLSLVGGEPNSFDFTAGSGAPNYGVHAYSRLVKYETFKYPEPAVARAAPDAAT